MLTSKDNSEIILWDRFRAGDSSALGQIFDAYILVLYKYGHKFTKDRTVVEDCIQDLFVELWNRRERISPTTSVRFYLFRALRQKMLRHMKQTNALTNLEDHFKVSHEAFHLSSSFSEEQIMMIRKAIMSLSPRQKEVIYLKFYNRLSNEEIAEVMEIDKGTVYNLVSLSLKKLRCEAEISFNAEFIITLPFFFDCVNSIF